MLPLRFCIGSFFSVFFNATATTEIYTLSLHDALPISIGYLTWSKDHVGLNSCDPGERLDWNPIPCCQRLCRIARIRSEEHTSELQSLRHLVCRLLLEKKKQSHI